MLRSRVGEADLLGEDGLACAGGAGEDDEGTRLESAPEDEIELRNTRPEPVHFASPSLRRSRLATPRSWPP